MYEICAYCDHFIEDNPAWVPEDGFTVPPFLHLDDGEKEHDHDAEPSEDVRDLGQWKIDRPELFTEWADGKIGPNSSMRGVVKGQLPLLAL